MLTREDTQTLISAYFSQKDVFVKHHLESYNEFLNVIVPSILNQYFPMTVKATDKNNTVQEIQLKILSSVYEHPHYTEKNGCRKTMILPLHVSTIIHIQSRCMLILQYI